jgi:hypothetical protein
LAITGAGAGDWCIGAFPCFVAPVAVPQAVDVFNFFQQINNSYTYIGQMFNQTTNLSIANSGANATNTAVVVTSLTNVGH